MYITRLASNEIFSPSNKIHREVGWAKDLSAPLYVLCNVIFQRFASPPCSLIGDLRCMCIIYRCVYNVSPGLISYAWFEWFISCHCVVAVSGILLPLQVFMSALFVLLTEGK